MNYYKHDSAIVDDGAQIVQVLVYGILPMSVVVQKSAKEYR